MPAPSAWNGRISLREFSFAVRAFHTVDHSPSVDLHLLHAECGQRIFQQRLCPVHGVTKDFVRGFEAEPGRHVLISQEEMDSIACEDNKSIEVDCFIGSDQIAPEWTQSRSLYLVPQEESDQRPFIAIRESMKQQNVMAYTSIVWRDRTYWALLRPIGKLILLTFLEYAENVRSRADYESEVPAMELSPQEQELSNKLVLLMRNEELDHSLQLDPHAGRLRELVQRKQLEEGQVATPGVSLGSGATNTPEAAAQLALIAALQRTSQRIEGALSGQRSKSEPEVRKHA